MYNKRQFFGIEFKAASVAAWQASFTILVVVIFIIMAVALQIWCEMLEKGEKVNHNNKRNKMKTTNNERKTISVVRDVKRTATKVAASITASIAGRCLLP